MVMIDNLINYVDYDRQTLKVSMCYPVLVSAVADHSLTLSGKVSDEGALPLD